MRDVEATIRAHLLTDTALTALVGTRIYAGTSLPAGYTPDDGPAVLLGVRGGADTYSGATLMPSVQFRSYGADDATARSVDRALYDALVDVAGLHVRTAQLETIGQLMNDPETDWPYMWSAYRVWVVNS